MTEGGLFLAVRQGMGAVLGLLCGLTLVRLLGPANYGLHTTAFTILTFAQALCAWGLDTYLIRNKEDDIVAYHQAFTLLCLTGALGTLALWGGRLLIEGWLSADDLAWLLVGFAASLPVVLLTKVPLALMERRLMFKRVALIDLTCQAVYYLAALPLAVLSGRPWALLVGWWIQCTLHLLLAYKVSGYRPALHWDAGRVLTMLRFGLGFSAVVWVLMLRPLVNPLLVGRYAGMEAVGFVALAIRLVDALGFVSRGSSRLVMATLARLQQEPARMARIVSEGMHLQLLGLGPFLLAFAWSGPWLVPLIFSSHWLPMLVVFPFVALGRLSFAAFSLHSSALMVEDRNWALAGVHTLHTLLFALSAWLFVPSLGLLGYGLAEAIALGSYLMLGRLFAARVAPPDYRLALFWWLGLALGLFAWETQGWSVLAVVAVVLWPGSWREVAKWVGQMKDVLSARRHASAHTA